tara:strand:+ start:146 stop:436 length:291 start_codon:yes stop_codon:yes gene_type:complete
MYLFTIEAVPSPKREESKNFDGAYVWCWISYTEEWGAERLARMYIEASGWIPGETTETSSLERSDCIKQEEQECFVEAESVGYCLVFHTWASEEPV